MADMERGTRPETIMASPLFGLTDLMDGTRPCWTWISDWMDMSAQHSTTG